MKIYEQNVSTQLWRKNPRPPSHRSSLIFAPITSVLYPKKVPWDILGNFMGCDPGDRMGGCWEVQFGTYVGCSHFPLLFPRDVLWMSLFVGDWKPGYRNDQYINTRNNVKMVLKSSIRNNITDSLLQCRARLGWIHLVGRFKEIARFCWLLHPLRYTNSKNPCSCHRLLRIPGAFKVRTYTAVRLLTLHFVFLSLCLGFRSLLLDRPRGLPLSVSWSELTVDEITPWDIERKHLFLASRWCVFNSYSFTCSFRVRCSTCPVVGWPFAVTAFMLEYRPVLHPKNIGLRELVCEFGQGRFNFFQHQRAECLSRPTMSE